MRPEFQTQANRTKSKTFISLSFLKHGPKCPQKAPKTPQKIPTTKHGLNALLWKWVANIFQTNFCSSYPSDCSSNNLGDIQCCSDGDLAAAPYVCSRGILSKEGATQFSHSTKSASQQHSTRNKTHLKQKKKSLGGKRSTKVCSGGLKLLRK